MKSTLLDETETSTHFFVPLRAEANLDTRHQVVKAGGQDHLCIFETFSAPQLVLRNRFRGVNCAFIAVLWVAADHPCPT